MIARKHIQGKRDATSNGSPIFFPAAWVRFGFHGAGAKVTNCGAASLDHITRDVVNSKPLELRHAETKNALTFCRGFALFKKPFISPRPRSQLDAEERDRRRLTSKRNKTIRTADEIIPRVNVPTAKLLTQTPTKWRLSPNFDLISRVMTSFSRPRRSN